MAVVLVHIRVRVYIIDSRIVYLTNGVVFAPELCLLILFLLFRILLLFSYLFIVQFDYQNLILLYRITYIVCVRTIHVFGELFVSE